MFTDAIGVIDHVNHERGVLHFVVSKDIQATWPLSKFPDRAEPGLAVSAQMAHFFSKGEKRCNARSVTASDALPKTDVFRRFDESIEVRNGLGFTPTGIFIPPDIVASQHLVDGDSVMGKAVVNFNKRRGVWGWKAISAQKCSFAPDVFDAFANEEDGA